MAKKPKQPGRSDRKDQEKSGSVTSGLDRLLDQPRKLDEDAVRRGWSPDQLRRAALVHFMLDKKKQNLPKAPLKPDFPLELFDIAFRVRAKLVRRISNAATQRQLLTEERFSELCAMQRGVEMLLENIRLNHSPPQPGGPYIGELCTSCRKRIVQRYRSDPDRKAVRLRFPKRQLEHERKVRVRDAWRATQEYDVYTRDEFVPIASKSLGLSPETIRGYLRRILKEP